LIDAIQQWSQDPLNPAPMSCCFCGKSGLILQVELNSFHFEEGQLKKFTAASFT
jgi:hypothetical protein